MSPTTLKKNMIDSTLDLLPTNSLLSQFSAHFLQSVPFRSLDAFTPATLADFLKDKFSFFQKTLEDKIPAENGIHRIIESADEKLQKFSLEIVCPDANYIIVTYEALFKEFGFPITRVFHPIFSVEKTENGLSSIQKAAMNARLVSFIHIEFEGSDNTEIMAGFSERVKQHLVAIQHSFRAQSSIQEKWLQVKESLLAQAFPHLPEPKQEWVDLIDWLRIYNLSVYGYMAFESGKTQPGIGILSDSYLNQEPSALLQQLKDHNAKCEHDSHPFMLDTIPVKSPVQRFDNLMRLSLKLPNAQGGRTEHIFLGLLKRSSLFVKNIETPLIHLKMQYIFEQKNMLPSSYDYNEVIRLFTSIPKFELFRTSKEDLLHMIDAFQSLANPNEVYCFSFYKKETSHITLYVVIPPSIYNKQVAQQIGQYIKQKVQHRSCEIIEIRAEEKCRLHIHFEIDTAQTAALDPHPLELEIRELIKPWDEQVKDLLATKKLRQKYTDAFPNHYKAIRTPVNAVKEIMLLETMQTTGSMQFSMQPFQFQDSGLSGKAALLNLYSQKKIDLITVMPILQNLGIHVFDELTTSVGPQKEAYGYIHSFRIAHEDKATIEPNKYPLLLELLTQLFNERTENDPLNALALKASLDWRAINVLQTYRNLALQLSTAYTREKMNQTLLAYPESASKLFGYFETKFSIDPSLGTVESRLKMYLPQAKQVFLDTLQHVKEVAEDLILKTFFNLMESTLRTNFYIPKSNGQTFISIKLSSEHIKDIPLPVPYREIYVHDVGMEGTHLRFGPVARGGLRWSDRPDDFRKEILGLVKTQQVKNVVIIPVGSKGGFVVKKKLPPKDMALESVKQYQILIQGFLDITDNIDLQGQVQHPQHMVLYDQKDPYLVVAADKGTANFSDVANDISDTYRFWLGDAFASGGSVGYNHKKEAITARGAWECTKLHFKELGKDILKDSITVAGIGDMSGDVFGNGMLLGKNIRLQAAFNHAHIFLDPHPDAATSWLERKRLFDLPRSSWQDYDRTLISTGGGIFDRKAKEIPLNDTLKKLLDVSAETLTGEEVIKAILRMKIDLLWFGGIGTYIKASYQTHSQVGDIANDAVRIDATECQALVVGEGANLGVTQLGRIEFNRRGGHINSDAIDNSAGVNMSDYEVNIKILLKRMLSEGVLRSTEERNQVLENATNEVSELVLENNKGQHQLLSMDSLRSQTQFQNFNNLIQELVHSKVLDAATENIPSQTELDTLAAAKLPLSRPVLSVVQAYVKMETFKKMVSSPILEDPGLDAYYNAYFPASIKNRFLSHLNKHHLKKEILSTLLTNRIVNQAGMCFYTQVEAITGKSVGDITLGYLVLDAALDGPSLRKDIETASVDQALKYKALIQYETLLQGLLVDMLQTQSSFALKDTAAFKTVIEFLKKEATHQKEFKTQVLAWTQEGFSTTLAQSLAMLQAIKIAADVVFLEQQEGLSIETSASLSLECTKLLELDWLTSHIGDLELSNTWDIAQKNSLLKALQSHKKRLLTALAQTKTTKWTSKQIHSQLSHQNEQALALYLQTLKELHHQGLVNLVSLSVAVNRLGF